MTTVTFLGLVAGAITSVAGIPQVIRVYRTKQVRDLSVWQPILLCIGITLWLIYGIAINDYPLIVADIVSLVCCLTLLAMLFRYRERDNCNNDVYITLDAVERRDYGTNNETGDGGCGNVHSERLRVQHDAG